MFGEANILNLQECIDDMLEEDSCVARLRVLPDAFNSRVTVLVDDDDVTHVIVDKEDLIMAYVDHIECDDDCDCINCNTTNKMSSTCNEGCNCINCAALKNN